MCGIVGIWGAPATEAELAENTRSMATSLTHRGPDGSGVWVDQTAGIGLGHRRLAIIDLSADGCQPMISSCGRYVLVFNGEIYNFHELRAQLERQGANFRGHSDTEVMLASFVRWGVKEALRRFNGMFAFALWDCTERALYLGRDRLGKKPLYYGQLGGRLLFGSELKALRVAPGWRAEIEPASAAAFFRYGFVPGDQSILRGIRRLPPGHMLRFASPFATAEPEFYWRFEEAVGVALAKPFLGSSEEAEQELAELLTDSVRIRRRADVPLGAFLSGGIDSSLVVALMQEAGGESVHTFTIGFADDEYDESFHAAEIARALGCRHTSTVLTPADLAKIVPTLPVTYDEPFADVSQVPTLLVSRLARREVTVCLSGDGGDELFGGYHRHFLAARYWPRLSRIPLPLRRALAVSVRWMDHGRLARLLRGRLRNPADKVFKALAAMESADLNELYRTLLSQGEGISGNFPQTVPLHQPQNMPTGLGAARRIMALDTLNYLPDDILVKADRASMAVALELRCPLLDHRLLEFSWRLPDSWLVNGGGGKIILRRLLGRHLPRGLFERPKMGFAVPIGDWLRGPLRPWAEEILLAGKEDLWLSEREVGTRWKQHQGKQAEYGHWLWRALIWRAWRDCWRV